MNNPLRDYQRKFIDAFVAGETQYGALDCGLGKTRCSIEIAKRLKAKRILVLCPASAKLAWVQELKKWSPCSKFHTPVTPRDIGAFEPYANAPMWTIVNFDKVSRDNGYIERLVAAGPYDLMVLDEAHYVKELTSKRTRAVFRAIAPVCKKILPLSATPMTRCAADLYAPLRFLKPEAITDKHGHIMTLHAFQDRYTNVEMKRIGPRLIRQVTGSRNMQDLKMRMGDFFYRLTKAECLPELPPMQFEQLPVGLDRGAYPELASIIGDLEIEDDEDLLAAAMQSAHIMTAMRMIGIAKVQPAAQYITDFLEGTEEKCVVWAKHHDVLDLMCTKLAHYNPAVIDGRVDMKGRAAAIKSFLEDPDCRVAVLQIAAAGTALTLLNETVQPRNVFFIEQEWSPSQNYQASSRVHRLGAKAGILVRTFTAQGVSLDMRLQAVLTRKMSEFEQLIDGDKNADGN